jgi:hypothetical protein
VNQTDVIKGSEIPEHTHGNSPEGHEHADHFDELEGNDVLGPLEENLPGGLVKIQ